MSEVVVCDVKHGENNDNNKKRWLVEMMVFVVESRHTTMHIDMQLLPSDPSGSAGSRKRRLKAVVL